MKRFLRPSARISHHSLIHPNAIMSDAAVSPPRESFEPKTLVEGAVGMVEMALEMLSAKNVVELDDERRAAMVSNLMVVLCSESAAQPVLNTGTLYP